MRIGAKGQQSDVELAFELYQQGKADEARQVLNSFLAKSPNHLQARALRDRIDNEEFQKFSQQNRENLALGEASPAMSWIFLGAGVFLAIVATALAIPALRAGFNPEPAANAIPIPNTGEPARASAPAQVLLIFPIIIYLAAGTCFYLFRRNQRE